MSEESVNQTTTPRPTKEQFVRAIRELRERSAYYSLSARTWGRIGHLPNRDGDNARADAFETVAAWLEVSDD